MIFPVTLLRLVYLKNHPIFFRSQWMLQESFVVKGFQTGSFCNKASKNFEANKNLKENNELSVIVPKKI